MDSTLEGGGGVWPMWMVTDGGGRGGLTDWDAEGRGGWGSPAEPDSNLFHS